MTPQRMRFLPRQCEHPGCYKLAAGHDPSCAEHKSVPVDKMGDKV